MKGSLALLAALAGTALASPMPQASSPAGCSSSAPGSFGINVVNVTSSSSKRSLEERQSGSLMLTLSGGILKDQNGRTGYIAANRQFQFDNPIQAGAVITSGWSLCSNGSLCLTSCVFYQCLSGSFYNLYDQSQGGQCNAIYIVSAGAGSAPAPAPASSAAVSQITDGQPQATTKATISQISDGQIQASTGRVTQITDGQIQAPTGKVSQITDGQVQAPTGKVSQITDGQVQAPTGKVSQITDGQVQAPKTTAAPPMPTPTGKVSQITDGQVQAPTGKVSQITDGQVQAPTGTMMMSSAKVSQISDGQIQAPTSASAVAPAKYTGAAARELGGSFALIAGVVGAVAML